MKFEQRQRVRITDPADPLYDKIVRIAEHLRDDLYLIELLPYASMKMVSSSQISPLYD